MKRIAIFCDGTWSGLDTGRPSHVARLARAVMPTASDGVSQLVYYQPGPGSGRGYFALTRSIDKWIGGAFGWGLDANLRDAYRQLMFWYEPGDEIYIFGYSRGAYLARSLVGLIRMAGIVQGDHKEGLRRAVNRYRRRDPSDYLDKLDTLRFRRSLSPLTATSPADLAWRQAQGDQESFFLRVSFLGVWDTVGALGMPYFMGNLAKLFNRRFAFHNHALSHMVWSARHAVAIDERRRLYPPTLWRNLDFLNSTATNRDMPYRQQWFPGNHSVVGGDGDVPELSACAAQWVIDGARERNLQFDNTLLAELKATACPDVPVPGGFDPTTPSYRLFGRWLLADRDQLKHIENVSETARQRVRSCPDYRPATLMRVLNAAEDDAGG